MPRRKRRDLTNQVFGPFQVTGFNHYQGHNQVWDVVCQDCGCARTFHKQNLHEDMNCRECNRRKYPGFETGEDAHDQLMDLIDNFMSSLESLRHGVQELEAQGLSFGHTMHEVLLEVIAKDGSEAYLPTRLSKDDPEIALTWALLDTRAPGFSEALFDRYVTINNSNNNLLESES
jgi:hypothetical protein